MADTDTQTDRETKTQTQGYWQALYREAPASSQQWGHVHTWRDHLKIPMHNYSVSGKMSPFIVWITLENINQFK